LFNKKRKNIKK